MSQIWSRVVFCHTPKTAGSSVTKLLREAMVGDHSVEDTQTEHPSSDIGEALRHCSLVSGHFNHREVLEAVDRSGVAGVRLLCSLRNPLDHVLSQYYHLISRESLNMAFDSGLGQLKKQAKESSLLSFFSGAHTEMEGFKALFDNPQIRLILNKMEGTITLADAQEAIAVMLRFDAVILFERLEESVLAILPHVGLGAQTRLPRLMTNPLKEGSVLSLSRTELQAIMAHTRFDAVLYDVVSANLLHKLANRPRPVDRQAAPARLHGARLEVLLADVIRASNACALDHAQMGETVTMREDSLFLHPPHGSDGVLRIGGADFLAQGQNRFTTKLSLEHEAAPPLAIVLTLRNSSGTVARFETVITRAAAVPLALEFAPLFGRCFVDIELRTLDPQGANNYAWAMLWQPRFCFAGSERLPTPKMLAHSGRAA